jgi:hypothetical protein
MSSSEIPADGAFISTIFNEGLLMNKLISVLVASVVSLTATASYAADQKGMSGMAGAQQGMSSMAGMEAKGMNVDKKAAYKKPAEKQEGMSGTSGEEKGKSADAPKAKSGEQKGMSGMSGVEGKK